MRPSRGSGPPSGRPTGSGPFEFPCSSARPSTSPPLSSSTSSRNPPGGSAHGPWVFQLSMIPLFPLRIRFPRGRSPESPLNRMQLRRAVANDHEKVLARPKLLVEGGISRVDAKDRRRGELAWCRDHDYVLSSDSPEDGRTHLEVPAPENETLSTHRAHHEPCLRGSVEEAEDLGFVQIRRDRLPSDHGVDSEQGLLDPERGCESLDGGAGSQQEQRVRVRLEQFGEVRRQFRADGLLAQLLDHELPGGHELRLNQRFGSGEESDSPFSFPIRFFVQVENFRDTDS